MSCLKVQSHGCKTVFICKDGQGNSTNQSTVHSDLQLTKPLKGLSKQEFKTKQKNLMLTLANLCYKTNTIFLDTFFRCFSSTTSITCC